MPCNDYDLILLDFVRFSSIGASPTLKVTNKLSVYMFILISIVYAIVIDSIDNFKVIECGAGWLFNDFSCAFMHAKFIKIA